MRSPASCLRALALASLLILGWSAPTLIHAQSTTSTDPDRPRLKHQAEPMTQYGAAEPPADSAPTPFAADPSQPLAAPGIHLPTTGTVWALDQFQQTPRLVHLKFALVSVDRHMAANIARQAALPFVYRQRNSVELQGAAASTRLHTAQPVIFVRQLLNQDEEEAANPTKNSTVSQFAIVRLEVQPDKRVVNTVQFSRFLLKAERSETVVDTTFVCLDKSSWCKLTPTSPLPPGEYGVLPLPKTQNTFATTVFDFAIDPTAPPNAGEILQQP